MADRILMPPLVRTEIKRLGREKILLKLATRDKSVRWKEVRSVSSRATFSSSHTRQTELLSSEIASSQKVRIISRQVLKILKTARVRIISQ